MEDNNAPIRPLKSDDFYSKAFDFYAFLLGEVDPRSGMYSARINFVSGEGNRLRGPHFDFKLAYSALDPTDSGFGKGWRLAISEFEIDTTGDGKHILRLSAGDSQKVTLRPTGTPCEFPDLKLKAYRFILQSDISATIEYATGPIEHLLPRRGTSRPLITHHITNPCGDSIHLDWTTDLSGNTALSSVRDDEGYELLRIDYRNMNLTVLHIPTTTGEFLEVHFIKQGGFLQSVEVPSLSALNIHDVSVQEKSRWNFQYKYISDLPLLEAIETPEGVREEVIYAANALTMPLGATPPYMPAVSNRKRFHMGAQSPFIDESSYTYDLEGRSANMYGYPLVTRWDDRNDQLLHHGDATFHKYGSTETNHDVQGRDISTVVRVYNNFHLPVMETTTRGSVTQSTATDYGIRPGVAFGNQPANFQLPVKITQELSMTASPNVIQRTVTTHTYDDEGNILTTWNDATRITETSTYYPVGGEGSDCPPDPLGMVARLKTKTVSPEPGDDAPVLTTSYRYISLPLRGDIPRQHDGWVQPNARTYYVQAQTEITTTHNGTPISFSQQNFNTNDGNWHGTVSVEETSGQGSFDADDNADLTREYFYQLTGDTIVTTTRETTHDNIVNETSEAKGLVNGLVLWNIDALGNRTEFDYDSIGRITRSTYCPGIPDYESTSTQAYQVSKGERMAVRTGITGLPHAVWMDALGRVIREDEPIQPQDGAASFSERIDQAKRIEGRWSRAQAIRRTLDETMITVRSLKYDPFGQVVSETLSDRFSDGRLLHITTTYAYDDLGQPSRITSADGTHTVSTRELVQIDADTVVLRTRQWRESEDGRLRSEWTSMDTDRAGLKRSVTIGLWDGLAPKAEASGEWRYDHAGRCISQIDAMGLETRQTWDDLNRPIIKTLPNGDAVRLTYAPRLASELPSSIEAASSNGTYRLLGKRSYDGLNRLVNEQAGSLTTQMSYQGKQLSPRDITLPGGGRITNTYDPRLGEVLLEQTEASIGRPIKSATYNKRLGLPSRVSANDKHMTIRTDYLGRMTEQDMAFDDGKDRHTKVIVSLGGLEMVKHSVDGAVRRFEYDEYARLIRMVDVFGEGSDEEEIITDFSFDALSRLNHRRSEEANSGRYVEEHTDYDDLGRPHVTTWISFDGKERTQRRLTLTFRDDNKIIGKLWQEGPNDTLVREESMEYDRRGRLITHQIPRARSEDDFPRDEGGGAYRGIGIGNSYEKQEFKYDEIDNILSVETTLVQGRGKNITYYTYDATDIDKLIGVRNTMLGYPGEGNPITLTYDANGNMTSDGIGTTLAWDSASRLTSVTLADGSKILYEYGPDGRVAKITKNQDAPNYRYYEDGNLRLEAGKTDRTFLRTGRFVMAESVLSKDPLSEAIRRTFLLEYDGQGSVHTVLSEPVNTRSRNQNG